MKRNARRKRPMIFHSKTVKKDGSVGWQGGKDLPATAAYTTWFCNAVFRAWQSSQPQVVPAEPVAVSDSD